MSLPGEGGTGDGRYDGHSTERWVPEPGKRDLAGPAGADGAAGADGPAGPAGADGTRPRGPFVRDRARVLHSSALRRLAAKTQVVAVGSGDFPRTRLTHSLECAQIGRELGAALGCDPDLVDAACLAHDLGHPPFGHNGEAELARLAGGCGGFEGNAQSLRLVTRLEAKVPGAGLNLTRATLDATLKYPWLGPAAGADAARIVDDIGGAAGLAVGPEPAVHADRPAGKYGAYLDDAAVFGWIRAGAPEGRPCLEAQLMDWADDVAYSVHDLEDGMHAGLVTLAQLRDQAEQESVAELTLTRYCAPGWASLTDLTAVFAELLELDFWPAEFDGSRASSAGVKNLTSELIGRLCRAAERATRPLGRPALRRYDADLTVPLRQRLECALLKGVTARYVMSRPGVKAAQARERELIAELAERVLAGAPATLDPMFRPEFEAAADDSARLRVVIDQIASLTDTSAHAWHKRLSVAGT